jgi:LETM1 and EF-hand domain-containing protein 1, mitochondrial
MLSLLEMGLTNVVTARAFPRSSLGPGLLARNSRKYPRHLPALALLIPVRHIGTEHHRPTPGDGPPPGFNAEVAKKPLKPETQQASKKEDEKVDASKEQSKAPALGETKAAAAKDGDADAASLTDLAAAKSAGVEREKDKKDEKKLTLGQKIKKEIQHYWDGTKLLAAEVRISTKLAVKMAAGYELTRRENKQLQRTVQDLGRLVPFSVFVIVPFAELLLPIALRLFPNLLPSTYEGERTKQAKATVLRATRKEVSDFLRTTLKETGLPLTIATTQKEEFATFFRKLRATGEKPTDQDVIKVCRIFRDDLTLDNLSRPQLVSMCRYMNLNTFGTDMMLRYQVRHRMRQIKRDDKAISYEGVESLTVGELQMACASRGIRTHGVSPARMRVDLQAWLDLRLKEQVPSTLLVLSNAYMYGQTSGSGEVTSQIDALTGVLSSIPEELFHEIELEVHNAEGAATNKQRLEVLKEQQELIEEENEQNEENQSTGFATPRDVDNIDEKEERHLHADSEGLAKDQVSEAVEAEQETVATAQEVKANAAAAAMEAKSEGGSKSDK